MEFKSHYSLFFFLIIKQKSITIAYSPILFSIEFSLSEVDISQTVLTGCVFMLCLQYYFDCCSMYTCRLISVVNTLYLALQWSLDPCSLSSYLMKKALKKPLARIHLLFCMPHCIWKMWTLWTPQVLCKLHRQHLQYLSEY